MGIKLTAFMTAYKFKKNDEEKLNMVKEHIKNEYIPYEKKADIAKAIADASYWRKVEDSNGNEYSELHVDSVAKYMLTCISMFDLYTDIERSKSKGNMLDDFNILNENGIFDILIQNMDERELKEFNMILDMTCDDVVFNEYENHAYITKQINKIGKVVNDVLSPIISQLDIGKIENIIEQVNVS